MKTSARRAAPFATIDEAILDLQRGRMVIVVDDEDRENEGDITVAAQFCTSEQVAFMRKHCSGVICVALAPERIAQLDAALDRIAKEGRGVLLYLRQEGRGIGLMNKLRAYALQDQGLDTVEANERLGFKADERERGVGVQILLDLGVRRAKILTNNPQKLVPLYGLEVVERIPIEVPPRATNRGYLTTKRNKL